jgi:hypothetical protein
MIHFKQQQFPIFEKIYRTAGKCYSIYNSRKTRLIESNAKFHVFMFSALFADDTTGLAKVPVLKDLTYYVNEELCKMENWFRANKMMVNASKTKFIIFRTHNKPVNPDDCNISPCFNLCYAKHLRNQL